MARWQSTSLEDVRALAQRVSQARAWDSFITPRNLVMNLMAEVGEVTEVFQWREDAAPGLPGWSEAERHRAAAELSDVLIAAVRLADSCGIDLGDAATERLEREAFKFPPVQHVPAPQPPAVHQAPAPAPEPHRQPAPAPAAPPVAARTSDMSKSPPGSSGGVAFRRPQFTRTLSVVTGKGSSSARADPTVVAQQFSPSHFDHGLFSPFTTQTDFEIRYGNERAPPLPKSLSQQKLSQQQQRQPDVSLTPPPLSPLSPKTLKCEFFPMIKALGDSEFSPREFKELELTWVLPISAVDDLPGTRTHYAARERFIDLKPQGRHIPVTLPDRAEYVRMVFDARDKLRQGMAVSTAGSPAPQPRAQQPAAAPGRLKRPGLKRTLSVSLPKQAWDPEKVADCYSPSHFDHGLFSPHSAVKDFEVDYGVQAQAMTMPRSLSKKQFDQLPAPDHDLSCLSPKTRELEEKFDPVMMELEQLADRDQITDAELEEMGITFCIPYRGRTYDLIPEGRKEVVRLHTLHDFLTLAKEKRMQLDRQGHSP